MPRICRNLKCGNVCRDFRNSERREASQRRATNVLSYLNGSRLRRRSARIPRRCSCRRQVAIARLGWSGGRRLHREQTAMKSPRRGGSRPQRPSKVRLLRRRLANLPEHRVGLQRARSSRGSAERCCLRRGRLFRPRRRSRPPGQALYRGAASRSAGPQHPLVLRNHREFPAP